MVKCFPASTKARALEFLREVRHEVVLEAGRLNGTEVDGVKRLIAGEPQVRVSMAKTDEIYAG